MIEGLTWNLVVRPIYYDFSLLVSEYPELKQRFYVDGKYIFTNHQALMDLTTTILIKYHNINIRLSPSNLCPRIPNRYLYLKWIETLLLFCKLPEEKLCVIDIGTGSSAIYPLLGCSLNKQCLFIATECNNDSFNKAKDNIALNPSLADRITLHKTDAKDQFIDPDWISENGQSFITICNPPFFDSLEKCAQENKMAATNLVAIDSELYCQGGETEFVKRLVKESISNQTGPAKNIRWYTSMVGRFSSLEPIVEELRKQEITNFGIFELNPDTNSNNASCEETVYLQKFLNKDNEYKKSATPIVRWIIAWSFQQYHLPNFLGHPHKAKFAGLNGINLVFIINSKANRSVEIERVLNQLKHTSLLVENISISSRYKPYNVPLYILEVPGDVWSRSYRRKMKRLTENQEKQTPTKKRKIEAQPIDFDSSEKSRFWIFHDRQKDQVVIYWNYGARYKIFESFGGFMKRLLEKTVK